MIGASLEGRRTLMPLTIPIRSSSLTRPNPAPLLTRLASRVATIRIQILVAFLIMSAITSTLGFCAALGINQAGILVSETFDKSLMSINFARSAAADFAGMEAALARRWVLVADPIARSALDERIETLAASMKEDLSIAAERSQSARAARTAVIVQRAAAAWNDERRRLLADTEPSVATWDALDQHAQVVSKQIDLLINYIAGDGFTYRQNARKAVAKDWQITLAGTGTALALSALIAWLLARRIIRPVAAASAMAGRIARGDLDGEFPRGRRDELGALLIAMRAMRDNIRSMMDREVTQRRSAQARLADALEASREGVIVVDAQDCIALANSQAREYFGNDCELLRPGAAFAAIQAAAGPTSDNAELLHRLSGAAHDAGEVRLLDGRWLRVGRSATRDGGFVAVLSDVTALRDKTIRLEAANLSLDAALDHMSQGLCLYDADQRLKVVNRRFCEIFHLSLAAVVPGLTFREVMALGVEAGNHPRESLVDSFRIAAAGVTPLNSEEAQFQELNYTRVIEISYGRLIAVSRRTMADGGWVTTFEDVTERRRAEAQIVFMAQHDALTGLPNRVLFSERVEQALAQAGRDRTNFAVLMLDLDRFKSVNDTLGHPVGDDLLRAVATRLNACVREVDTVARLGGDEFAIVQAQVERPEETTILARRIIEMLSAPYEIDGHHVVVGTSIGASFAPGDGSTCAKLLKNADVALYRAKAEGRGIWRFFEPEMDARLQARRVLELDLRAALANGEFELHYQPLYDLRKERIGGFEALLRWFHPVRGLVSPTEFVPIAEEIALIVPLGNWVLRQACKDACAWPDYVKVAVNVSPAQFKGRNLVETVKQALDAAGLPANRLELEITETVLLAENDATIETLHGLRDLGVRISMDDFGTGYSSLSYLRSFPFDKIKIDQSFIRDLATTDGADVIVRAMIGLGENLGMRTTAEGVETETQLAWLREEGCSEAQGYLFSTPRPACGLADLFQQWDRTVSALTSPT